MAGYLSFPFAESSEHILETIFDNLKAKFPGWTPSTEGAYDVALAEEIARVVSDLKALTADVAAAAVVKLGETVHKLPRLPGKFATLAVDIVTTRTPVTLPVDFVAYGVNPDGSDVAFVLDEAVTIRPTDIQPYRAILRANIIGEDSNGVGPGELAISFVVPYVESITAVTPSSGGVDPELDSEYLDRLTDYISTLGGALVLPRDFAVRARDVEQVNRAYVLDGYNPDDGTTNNIRTVTVFPIDDDGAPVSLSVRNQLVSYLDELREVNFIVKAAQPTYTPVLINFTGVAETGYDPVSVQEAVTERAYELISPALFGGGEQTPPVWNGSGLIRYTTMVRELGSVPGVAFLDEVTINGQSTNVTLPGVAPLPAARNATTPSTVSGVMQ